MSSYVELKGPTEEKPGAPPSGPPKRRLRGALVLAVGLTSTIALHLASPHPWSMTPFRKASLDAAIAMASLQVLLAVCMAVGPRAHKAGLVACCTATLFGLVKTLVLFLTVTSTWVWALLMVCVLYPVVELLLVVSTLRVPPPVEGAAEDAGVEIPPSAGAAAGDAGVSVGAGAHTVADRMTRRRQELFQEKMAKRKAKRRTGETVSAGRIIALSKPDAWLLLAGFLSLLVAAVSAAYIPRFTGAIVDHLVVASKKKEFDRSLVLLLGAGLAAATFTGLRGAFLSVAIARLKVRLRRMVFAAVLSQECGFFDKTRSGDITSRLIADTTALGDQIGLNVNAALRSLLNALVVGVLMASLNLQLTLLTFCVVPAVTLASRVYGNFVRRLSTNTQASVALANQVAEEVVTSITTVKAFHLEDSETRRFNGELSEFYRLSVQTAQSYGGYAAVTTFLPTCVTTAVLYFGGRLVQDGRLTAGDLVSFLLYQVSLNSSVQSFGSVYGGLQQGVGAATQIFAYLDRKPSVVEGGHLAPPVCSGNLEFANVVFSYPTRPEVRVTDGLNLSIPGGSMVALCGPSGGGKSSLLKLLCRFYDPDRGSVLLDGRPLPDYETGWRHGQVAIVLQDPILFDCTIRENIECGLDGVPFADVVQAAKDANAHDFIMQLPRKYDTECGERGVRLSGGQKQRIAIARAFVRKPAVLLLDEATSALDAESEALVQSSIDSLAARASGAGSGKPMTVVIVAHRLSTVRNCDTVCVIDNGSLVESGTFSELVAADGVFARLVARQLTA